MNGDPIIDVHGMTKRFGDRTVVDHVDLTVRQGEIFGFLGPNGSGKTTFLRMLCGLLRADDGDGTCLGHDVIAESESIKREVGYMTQRFSFWEDLSNSALPDGEVNSQASSPADGNNASHWPRVSFTNRTCSCLTSRQRASIQKRVAISGMRFIVSQARG